MLPAVGQGTLGVETRADDAEILALAEPLTDAETRTATLAERAFLEAVGGTCTTPAGRVRAASPGTVSGLTRSSPRLTGRVSCGTARWGIRRRRRHWDADWPPVSWQRVPRRSSRSGGSHENTTGLPLQGRRILVTRPRAQAAQLTRLLEAYGAETVRCPPSASTLRRTGRRSTRRSAPWTASAA